MVWAAELERKAKELLLQAAEMRASCTEYQPRKVVDFIWKKPKKTAGRKR